ncbi:MAG: virulence RhuM family protein [Chitinivibrionia bacterium]|nr:virulence RhuM family protein [Chitinivibrionia bacterium]
MNQMHEIIVYESGDSNIELSVDFKNDTVWATQSQIEKIFAVDQSGVSRHIRNIFKDGEVDEKSNMQKLHIPNSDKPVAFYSLDVILSVGYRANSGRAIEFRKWANQVLKEYVIKGYSFDQRFERLENRMSETEKKIDFFVKTAQKSIILIDNYINESTLTIFSKRMENVKVMLFTKEISKQLKLDIERFNEQYPPIEAKEFDLSHDRFLIVDDKEVYHWGASLKDSGKKWFAFSKMDLDGLLVLEKIRKWKS